MSLAAKIFACLALTVLGPQEILADQPLKKAVDEMQDARPAQPNPDNKGLLARAFELGPGDRIKIRVYDRGDLSGNFRVRADGTISLPLVGSVQAEGKKPGELEKEVSAAIARITTKEVSLTLEVDNWRPIYTVGDVGQPGVYPFSPGMTVLHAIAAAGGIFRRFGNTDLFDLTREKSRELAEIYQTTEKLKYALSRKARITAEQNGEATVPMTDKLLQVAGPLGARRLVAAENRLLLKRTMAHKPRLEKKQEEIELIKNEKNAYKEQLKKIHHRISLTKTELKRFDALALKGLALSARILALRTTIATLEGQSHTVLALIARSEQSLARANEEKTLLTVNRQLELEQELKRVDDEIGELEVSLRASKDFIRKITSIASRSTSRHNTTTYEILRLAGQQQELFSAEEKTPLKPGDVLRVTISDASPLNWSTSNDPIKKHKTYQEDVSSLRKPPPNFEK